jgi:thiopeptide-type bacteriocin biosynthesis protein
VTQWIYLKLVHSPGPRGELTDALLLNCVGPAWAELRDNSAANGWFFLRYLDTDGFHLRLRVRPVGDLQVADVRAVLARWTTVHAHPVRLLVATYEPEFEKYGGVDGVCAAEEQFRVSSEFALICLGQTTGSWGARLMLAAHAMRWVVAAITDDEASQRAAIGAYSAYWRAVNPGSDQPAEELADLWRRLRGSEHMLLAEFGLETAYRAWQSGTHAAVSRLLRLREDSMLSVDPMTVGLNLTHTFHNRLGLSLASELAIARLLVT